MKVSSVKNGANWWELRFNLWTSRQTFKKCTKLKFFVSSVNSITLVYLLALVLYNEVIGLLLPVTRAFGGRGSKLFIARKNPRDQVLKFSQWFTDWIILLCANFKGFTIIGSAIYLMKRAFFLLKLHFFNGFRWLAKKSHWLSTHSVNGIMYTHMSSNS